MNGLRARLLRWLGVEPTPWTMIWVDTPGGAVPRFNDEGKGVPLYVLASEKHLAEEKP